MEQQTEGGQERGRCIRTVESWRRRRRGSWEEGEMTHAFCIM